MYHRVQNTKHSWTVVNETHKSRYGWPLLLSGVVIYMLVQIAIVYNYHSQRAFLFKSNINRLVNNSIIHDVHPNGNWSPLYPCSQSLHHNHVGLEKLLNVDIRQPVWMKSNGKKPPYFLIEAIQVRIYEEDKAKWTVRELKQWIHYMLWAGVEHICVCDHYKFHHERLDIPLKRYIDLGLVTYLAWNHTRAPMTAQMACYRKVIDMFGRVTHWMITVDMDEYPFVRNDTQEGFLVRYLRKQNFDTVDIQLHNFLMLGVGDRRRDMVIERIDRRSPNKSNNLDKPIFKPLRVTLDIHVASPLRKQVKGHKLIPKEEDIKLIHYWGGRLQNWGPDTEEIRNTTVTFTQIRDNLAPYIRMSLLLFGECDAFNSTTGP